MNEEQGSSWLSSVLHVGVVDFARMNPAQRAAARMQVIALIQPDDDIVDSDCVLVDASDGITVCFPDDPEDALSTALGVREQIQGQRAGSGSIRVRLGIHHGPTHVSRRADGGATAAGDGPRGAQQLAAYALADQVLVSEMYYDVIANVSPAHAQSFRRLGQRRNLHGQECHVYEIARPGRPAHEASIPRATPGAVPLPDDAPNTEMISYSTGWERAELTAAAEALEPFVGALARVHVKKAAETATDVKHLYRLLAENVPAGPDREKFLRKHGVEEGLPASQDVLTMIVPPPEMAPVSIDPALQAVAERMLANLVGPLAPVLVKKHARQSLSVEQFIAHLANELQDAHRRDFMEKMRHVLRDAI